MSNQGFAIAVAGFLLIRIEAKLDKVIAGLDRVYSEVRDLE